MMLNDEHLKLHFNFQLFLTLLDHCCAIELPSITCVYIYKSIQRWIIWCENDAVFLLLVRKHFIQREAEYTSSNLVRR